MFILWGDGYHRVKYQAKRSWPMIQEATFKIKKIFQMAVDRFSVVLLQAI